MRSRLTWVLFATAVVINGVAFAGDFSGTVAYAAGGERCVEHGNLQMCLEGAKPSRSQEFAVRVRLVNVGEAAVHVDAADFIVSSSREGDLLTRRTVKEFEYIMRRRLRYAATTVEKASRKLLDGKITLAPGEETIRILRWRLAKAGSKGLAARKKPSLRGERYLHLYNLDLPLWLELRFRGNEVGRAWLHWFDYGGANDYLALSKFGLENWERISNLNDGSDTPEYGRFRRVVRLFARVGGLFVLFDDGGFIVAEEPNATVCNGKIVHNTDDVETRIRFVELGVTPCRPGPRLFTNRSKLGIRILGDSCELVGMAGAPWPATEPAACPP